jgi:type I restriction enzyme R subunit
MAPGRHNEQAFEDQLCAELEAGGTPVSFGAAVDYDRARALLPADLLAWVQESQPEAWAALVRARGAQAGAALIDRVVEQRKARGTLELLRQGVELIGVRSAVQLAQFQPALRLNPALLTRYGQNRLRVVRQLRYAQDNENCIDLVLFVNGLPVATAELKSDFTQRVEDAIDQYREDRDPQPKGGAAEPLLQPVVGALVHFAVSGSEVYMTTRLEGRATRFLPFNQGAAGPGRSGGKGNPPATAGQHPSAYLWRAVWQRDAWLRLLGRTLVIQRDKKGRPTGVLFPRYHQLDVVQRLEAAVRARGPGGRYLVQHSAGSGKTNSIAWTAHMLAELHGEDDAKVFDSVLVVSDRTVIDSQLQEAIFGMARQTGVVATVKGEAASKSGELAAALAGGKKVVVCTIQTFPFALAAVRELAATKGKRFAVLADEAHSSQTGEAAASLRAVLSEEEAAALRDGGELSVEDLLLSQMGARADAQAITFVAFTATPKAKTLELFGQVPDPSRPAGPDNLPAPFHVYAMRQAIEEGFILDVLRNYTPYSLAFKLAQGGVERDSREVERSAALKKLMGWVRLHPYNIAQKVEVVVEHYRAHVAGLLGGRAKGMVVVGSRAEAVRWKRAVDAYLLHKGYPLGALVAFSGEVEDPDDPDAKLTERSPSLNAGLRGRDIREAFTDPGHHLLLVANKFQTGFDQPLLCGMYVDKRLAGVQAVQTLSRLNRAHPGKDTTYVVDFVNSAEEVLAAFKTYYETAQLEATTDPNLVFDLRARLDATGVYSDEDVQRVVDALLLPSGSASALDNAVRPVAQPLLDQYARAQADEQAAVEVGDAEAEREARAAQEALLQLRADMEAYVRLYTFLSQIFDYGNSAVEARALFYKVLLRLLKFGRARARVELGELKLTHHALRKQAQVLMPLHLGERPALQPMTATGTGGLYEPQRAPLDAIIESVNSLFDGDVTETDKLVYVNGVILGKMLESTLLQQQAQNNSKAQFWGSPDLVATLRAAIMDALDAHGKMSAQALRSEDLQSSILRVLMDHCDLYERLRQAAG